MQTTDNKRDSTHCTFAQWLKEILALDAIIEAFVWKLREGRKCFLETKSCEGCVGLLFMNSNKAAI